MPLQYDIGKRIIDKMAADTSKSLDLHAHPEVGASPAAPASVKAAQAYLRRIHLAAGHGMTEYGTSPRSRRWRGRA